MRKTFSTIYILGATTLLVCAGSRAVAQAAPSAAPTHAHPEVAQSGMQPMADDDFVNRVREATAKFKSLDAAEAAGYPRVGGACLANPTQGGMGYHHMHEKLMEDDKVELEHPEVLVFYKTPSGEYALNGVEYYVPFSAHPGTAPAPTVAGRKLKKFERGQFWYLHAWVWLDNPSGLNADWNPKVTCL